MPDKFITIPSLGGLVTSAPADKIPDRSASECAGIDFSLDGMIQTNKGYDIYGNRIVAAGSCTRGFKYKKNFGTLKDIKIRVRDTGSAQIIEWFNPVNKSDNSDGYWETLKGGLTTGAKLGYAPANGDGGSKTNKLVMGNAVDNMMVWNGSTASVASNTSNTIVINEAGVLLEGFLSAGKVLINGTEYTYTGVSGQSFTGVTPDPGTLVANVGISQLVDSDILTEHIMLKKTTIAFVHNQPNSNDTITDSANGFSSAGFTSGQKIAVTGSSEQLNNRVYTIKTVADGTLTLADTDVVVGASAGDEITIAAGSPKGNILLTSQRKLFLSGVKTNESKVYYSESGEVTSFGITSGLGSGGSFDLMEGGGPITLMESRGKNTVVIHKTDAIIAYTRDNDGTNAIEDFTTLQSGDSVGATNTMGEAFINKTSFFVSQLEGVKSMEEVSNNQGQSSLDIRSITDIIMPTIADWDFSNCSIAYYPKKRVLLIAANDDNDVRKVISIYVKMGEQNQKYYDISIDAIPAQEFIVDGSSLYFVSSLDQNTYVMYGRFSANGTKITHRWVSKEFTFADPATLKSFNTMYIDGFISDLARIKATILYGLLGSDGSKSEVISWNDEHVSTAKVSALGTDVLGTMSLGASNPDISNSYYFSFPIHFNSTKSTRYKIILESQYDDATEYDAETYWAVINLSTNPKSFGAEYNKMRNSNI